MQVKELYGAKVLAIEFPHLDAFIYIAVTDNPENYLNEFKIDFRNNTDGITFTENSSNYHIVLPYKLNYDVIVHECFHALTRMFNDRNIQIILYNDEETAYYIGYISNIAIQFTDECIKTKEL